MREKYANPGMYLDTDDHGRLIEENREKLAAEEAQRLKREMRQLERTLQMCPHLDDVRAEFERKERRLEYLAEKYGEQ